MIDEDITLALDTIRALEARRYRAMADGDTGWLRASSSPDMSYVHSTGRIDDLDSYIDGMISGAYVYDSVDHTIDNIRLFDSTAVVTGGMEATGFASGKRVSVKSRVTVVWVHSASEWRIVAVHSTRQL